MGLWPKLTKVGAGREGRAISTPGIPLPPEPKWRLSTTVATPETRPSSRLIPGVGRGRATCVCRGDCAVVEVKGAGQRAFESVSRRFRPSGFSGRGAGVICFGLGTSPTDPPEFSTTCTQGWFLAGGQLGGVNRRRGCSIAGAKRWGRSGQRCGPGFLVGKAGLGPDRGRAGFATSTE